ncbi:MAG: hypothetical protein GX874_11745 [Smithella sp.]|nr:hypothetical protein [Smithella sp.]
MSREVVNFGGSSFLHQRLAAGYPGRLYPINPKASEMRARFCRAGIPAYPSFERAIDALARFGHYCRRVNGK